MRFVRWWGARTDTALPNIPLFVFLAWTAYGAVLLTQNLLTRPPGVPAPYRWYGPWLYWLGHAWTWAAFSPFIAFLVRRSRRTSIFRVTTVHVIAILVINTISILVDTVTMYTIQKRFLPIGPEMWARGIGQTLLLYATVVLGVLALDHARLARARALHAAQLETDLQRARLETLRRQLQPHFLFNTLNTIAALIDADPERAGAMVTRLGDLLRRSLDEHELAWIPLDAELDFLRLYTEIEQVRFEGWLTVRNDIDPALHDVRVPPMILQPLVENAIRHGISPLKRAGTVVVRATRVRDQRVQLEVADDGVGIDGEAAPAEGIGLGTTRARLAHLFGSAAELRVEPRPGGGTVVRVVLPLVRVQPTSAGEPHPPPG